MQQRMKRRLNKRRGDAIGAAQRPGPATASPLPRRLGFEALENRRLLAAAYDDGGSADDTNVVDRPGPTPAAACDVAGASLANSVSELPAGQPTPAPTDAANAADADRLDWGAAAMLTIPRGRPTINPGMSTFVADNGSLLRGPFASTEWGNPPPLSAIQSIKSLGANAIHLYGEVFNPNYVAGVNGPGDEPGYAVNRIDQMVQMTRDEGLYLVLTIGNGANNGTFNYDYVMDFWKFYAPRYGDETHVIFEIQNEPHAWSAPYPRATLDMEADAYTLIRSLAPQTPILLFSIAVLGSGPAAVADIQQVSAAASVDWTKAAVAFHGYAGYEDTTEAVEYILSRGYPVFMTEFTASDWGMDTDVLDVELAAELERLNVSWLTFQHIPPNFIGTAFTAPDAFYQVVNKAGLSWVPDFGDWPAPRGVYGNSGQPRATTGLTGTVRIEAEHFDTGAQGVAYADADAVNQGGQLRVDVGVDIEMTADAGGGHHLGSIADGEWLEYTIFVTEPGFHDLRLRIAGGVESAVRILFNGKDVTGPWSLPSTGGSQAWMTVTRQVFLEYGRQKLRLEVSTGGFHLNWLEISPASSGAIMNGAYKFLNRASALALEANTTRRTVEQSGYTAATHEQWNLVHRGAGQYSITSVANNWSWSTFYDSNGEPVTLAPWGYDGHADRRFIVVPADSGYYYVLVADGGLSLEIDAGSLEDGAPALQREYQGAGQQHWAILTPTAPSFPSGLRAVWGAASETPGDYHSDQTVDGADFLAWQRALGDDVAPSSGADGNGNGVIDGGDLGIWSDSFGHAKGAGWVRLSWNPVAGAAAYNVKRSEASGGPYTTIAAGVTATSYSDLGLTAGGDYFYVVTAVAARREGLPSAEARPPVLHAHWQFDESTGVTAADSTGRGWSGTLVNGGGWTTGVAGNAVDLDGSNDHVRLPTSLVAGMTEVTVAAWVRLDNANRWSRIFDFGTGTNNYMFLTPRNGVSNVVRFAIRTPSVGEQIINGDASLPTGVWTHVAVTLGNGAGILYVNGVEAGRNNSITLTPSSLGATTRNYIGRSQFADPYLQGAVDDFRIYDQALTAAEVAALSAVPLAAAEVALAASGATPLVRSWPADDGGPGQLAESVLDRIGSVPAGFPESDNRIDLLRTGRSDAGRWRAETFDRIPAGHVGQNAVSARIESVAGLLDQQRRAACLAPHADVADLALVDLDGPLAPTLRIWPTRLLD